MSDICSKADVNGGRRRVVIILNTNTYSRIIDFGEAAESKIDFKDYCNYPLVFVPV